MSGTIELAKSYSCDTRFQNESETVTEYIVALKKIVTIRDLVLRSR